MTHQLVGKTLLGVKLAKDKQAILLQTTDGDIVGLCDADCCSHTWIEEIVNTIDNFPALVLEAEETENLYPDGYEEYEFIQYYGFNILTDRGSIIIDYRNSSNGYYGGSLSWPGDRYYGGVYNQNVSTEEWE